MKLLNKIYSKILTKLKHDLDKNPKTSNVVNISRTSCIDKSALLINSKILGEINIAEGCKIINGVELKGGAKISIGRYTAINGPFTDIRALIHPVEIGSFCSIARGVNFQEYNHNLTDKTTFFYKSNLLGKSKKNDVVSKGAIKVGNDVWIGTQCVILSGADIGDGAVIAANSVVTGKIPPYAIAAGSPAKVIKYRFDNDKIEYFLKIRWWNMPIEEIREFLNS